MKKVDERIEKSSNALAAKLLWVMIALQVVVLIVKLCMGGAAYCLLDGLALAVGLGITAVLITIKGVWRAGDDILREIRSSCLSKGFMAMLITLLFGEFVLIMLDPEHSDWYAASIIVWSIPALIYTILAVKNGLFQWGGKKAETTGKAKLARATALGALFFGIVNGGPECIKDGAFNPMGLLKIIIMGAMWGILFYIMFSALLKIGEKQADKAEAEAEHEE